MDTISVLVALDANYLPQLQVLLTSIRLNNPGERVALYLLYSAIPDQGLAAAEQQCTASGYSFHPVRVDDTLFQDAPSTRQYPKEMYYRLLAARLLPDTLDRVLYLDPDILVINPLRPLWETDLQGNLFAAAAHTGMTELANGVNRVRLGSERILALEDALWNYDARNYNNYLLRSGGVYKVRWVMEHTAILHFCGKAKPWKPGYLYRFGVLYQHYAQIARRMWGVEI